MDRGQSWSDRRVGGGTTILGGCPPGSYSRIYGWHKSETFSAELGWPLLWDIPIYVWHSHISSLGIPVSHSSCVVAPTPSQEPLALQKLSDWLIQVSKYWNLYPHASRRYQKLPWLLLPTYFTTIKNQCQTTNMAIITKYFKYLKWKVLFFRYCYNYSFNRLFFLRGLVDFFPMGFIYTVTLVEKHPPGKAGWRRGWMNPENFSEQAGGNCNWVSPWKRSFVSPEN